MTNRKQLFCAILCAGFLLLAGCGTPPTKTDQPPEKTYKNPEDNPAYWVEKTSGVSSSSNKYITYSTTAITENWPGESLRWSLRTITENGQQTNGNAPSSKIAHQLYFHIRYKGDWRNYQSAMLEGITTKNVSTLSKETSSCDYGCIFEEDFTVALSKEELQSLANKAETKARLTCEDPKKSTLLLLPGPYIEGHLIKVFNGK